MTVKPQSETFLHEVVVDFTIFQCEEATLAGRFGQIDGFLNKGFRRRRFVEKRFNSDGGSPGKLAQAEFHHRHQHGPAQHHEQGGCVDERPGRPAEHD